MATYFVKTGGSDAAAGTSDATAWATISKVNSVGLSAGDIVQFRQGDTFTGQLYRVWPAVTLRSYDPATSLPGTGRAIIQNTTPDTVLGMANGTVGFTVDNLELKTSEATSGAGQHSVIANDANCPITGMVIRNCLIHQAGGSGIIVNNASSASWVIDGNTIYDLGDNGILFNHVGDGHEVKNCIIHDTGKFNGAQGRHGIYADALNVLIHDNEFYACSNGQACSLRYAGTQCYNNRIHDTNWAIGFFDYSAVSSGKVLIYKNRCWNIANWAFYSDGTWSGGGFSGMSLVIANNTFLMLNGAETALALQDFSHGNLTVANNVCACPSGSMTYMIEAVVPVSGKAFVEKNNLFFGGGNFRWNGTNYASLAAYVAAAAGAGGSVTKGLSGLVGDPNLSAAPTLAPNAGSPVIDAGTTNVDAQLSYVGI